MEIWEEAGLTREEYEEAMEEASRAFGWDTPPSEADVCAMHVSHVADTIRQSEHSGAPTAGEFAEVLSAYDDMFVIRQDDPELYDTMLSPTSDFSYLERFAGVNGSDGIGEVAALETLEERFDRVDNFGRFSARAEGLDWDSVKEDHGVNGPIAIANGREHDAAEKLEATMPSGKLSDINLNGKPNYGDVQMSNEKVMQLEGAPRTQRDFESANRDRRVLNSIENGRSNPDFDFDEYDDDDDDMSYGDE